MKQNIYLKTGLMKGVSLILRSKKVYFEGKIIYSISFYGNNNIGHASCCLIMRIG